MNEIDDILDFLNIDSWDSPSAEKNPVCEEKPETEDIPTIQSEGIPDEDLDNILLDNGFVITEGVEEEPTMDVQERQEEVEDENIDIEDDLSESNTYSNDEQTEDATVENNEDSSLLIKPNSPTLVMDDSSSRFSGTEWYNEITKQRIILAGLGGIGSWTALQLARMCPASMFLYDDDIVESANMSGQLYSLDDIGISKVDAISKMIKSYTSTLSIFSINQKFTSNTETGNIMICGFDNMEARRVFFNAWQKHVWSKPRDEWDKCLFIDGRLSIDTLQVLAFTGDNDWAMEEYRDKYLFTDDEAEHTVCSMKQTTYMACMIGSIIVNLFTNYVANLLNPIIPYDLPFFTEYDSKNIIFKTAN